MTVGRRDERRLVPAAAVGPHAGTPVRSVAAVVLAAGESRRLGEFKPLLAWPDAEGGEPLAAYQVRQLLAAGAAPVVVVTGARAAAVAAAARAARAVVVFNPRYREGKSSSVRAGVAATPEGAALLMVGVDQPRPAWFYRRLIGAAGAGAAVVIPCYGGRRGHPPLFAATLRSELLEVSEETQGLRAVVRRPAAETLLLELGSALALVNLNTAEDVQQARGLAAADEDCSPR